MTKRTGALIVGLSIVLGLGVAFAQGPSPEQPDRPEKPPMGEKADKEENLQKGAETERPWARGVSADQQRQALEKFREGNDLLNDGLFARASESYKAALAFWAHPGIHYNLALAQMNLDQFVDAFDNFGKSLAYGAAPLEKEKFERAKEYMVLLEKQIATIEVSCDKPGAKVSVDGKEVFVAPGTYKARVLIGRHTFVAEKQGYTTRVNAPFVGPGENFRIELRLYTAEELTRYNRRWQATWMPYAVIGGGIAAGLAGVVLELSANASYNDYDKAVAACNTSNAGCPTTSDITSIRDSGDSKKTMGYVAYGVAGAAVATGVLLAILNRPKAYQIRPEDLQEEQDSKKVTITPLITPNLAGAMVQGSF